jgi:predicted AlkP superfamily pyrophosphatase or phosphodiesterase
MSRALWLSTFLCACAQAPASPPPVILVSIDGFRADYLDRGLTPVMSRLANDGVRAEALIPVFPTKTFPNHYSIVTGRWPGVHGIIGNEFFAPELGRGFRLADREAVRDARFWGAEPIWVTAELQGIATAPFFWPGSEAAIGGIRPAYVRAFDPGMPDTARVRQVLEWLDLPPGRRPGFLTLYTDVVDAAGHEFGPDAPETRAAIARADSLIGLLVTGLKARGLEGRVNFIVVSDHGMTSTSPQRVIHPDDFVDRDAVEVDALSPVLMLRPHAGLEDSIYRGLRRAPHLSTYRRAELPERYHLATSPRVPPLVAIADEGWEIRWRTGSGAVAGGDHGYDDSLPSMRATFLAHGPGFRRGVVVPPFRNIHLYALLAELLGVSPAPTDGSLDSVRTLLSGASTTSAPGRAPSSPSAAPARAGSSAARAPR